MTSAPRSTMLLLGEGDPGPTPVGPAPFPETRKVLRPMKVFLLVLGTFAGILIVAQLVMAQLILGNPASAALRASHRHSGYLMVAVALTYIVLSLVAIASQPRGGKV